MSYQILSPEESLSAELRKTHVDIKEYQHFVVQLNKLLVEADEGLTVEKKLPYFTQLFSHFWEHICSTTPILEGHRLIISKNRRKSIVWIETVHPLERTRFISRRSMLKPAFFSVLRDYLLTKEKDRPKYIIISNIFEWYIIHHTELDRLLVKLSFSWEERESLEDLNKGEGLLFCREVENIVLAHEPIKSITYFNLYGLRAELLNNEDAIQEKLLPINKILSETHLFGRHLSLQEGEVSKQLLDNIKKTVIYSLKKKDDQLSKGSYAFESVGKHLIPKQRQKWCANSFLSWAKYLCYRFIYGPHSSRFFEAALPAFIHLAAFEETSKKEGSDNGLFIDAVDGLDAFEFVPMRRPTVISSSQSHIDIQDTVRVIDQLAEEEVGNKGLWSMAKIAARKLVQQILSASASDLDTLYEAAKNFTSTELKMKFCTLYILDPWLGGGKKVIYVTNALIEIGLALGIYGKTAQATYQNGELSVSMDQWNINSEHLNKKLKGIIFKAKCEILQEQLIGIGPDPFSVIATQLRCYLDLFQFLDENKKAHINLKHLPDLSQSLILGYSLLSNAAVIEENALKVDQSYQKQLERLQKHQWMKLQQSRLRQKELPTIWENLSNEVEPISVDKQQLTSANNRNSDEYHSLNGAKKEIYGISGKDKDQLWHWWDQKTERKGFDLILSQPASISQADMADVRTVLKERYTLYQYQAYSYMYVVEKAMELLAYNSEAYFVLPSAFQQAKYAESFRTWLSQWNYQIHPFNPAEIGRAKFVFLSIKKEKVAEPNATATLFS